jgi:hypothetical protein
MGKLLIAVVAGCVALTAFTGQASAGTKPPVIPDFSNLPSWDTGTSSHGRASYTYDKDLSWWARNSLEAATTNGARPKRIPLSVYVKCYTDRQSFEAPLYRRGEVAPAVIAYYNWPRYGGDGGTIHMRAGTCNLARQFTQGRVTQETAGAFKTLLHESLHRQGIHKERATEELAIASMQSAGQLVEFNRKLAIGYPWTDEQDRAWTSSAAVGSRAMRLAWQQSQRMIARSYLSPWSEVAKLNQTPVFNWADYLQAIPPNER